MARQGGDKPSRPTPAAGRPARGPAPAQAKERTTPKQYIAEVRGEMRKVAWPSRAEIINSSLVVIVAVAVMTALIFGFDYLSAKFVLFLFD
jgi:preprotein translocase subunit SecE